MDEVVVMNRPLTSTEISSLYKNGSGAEVCTAAGCGNNSFTPAYTYDNNGNLTSSSGTAAYTWDYLNRLITASSSSATSTYGYDYTSQRVKLVTGTSTTYYPETTYNVNGSTTIKHIFMNGLLVATVTSGTVRYVSGDMLGGSNVVTSASGTVVETLQYFPYGKIRIDNAAGSYSGEARKYIGQQYDAATALNYLNARYQDPNRGQFISEDPMFLGNPTQQILSDPQSLNAYSYAEDNPIVRADPTGKFVPLLPIIIFGLEVRDAAQFTNDAITAYQMSEIPYAFSPGQLNYANTQVGVDVGLFATSLSLSASAKQGFELLTTAADAMDKYLGGALKNNKKFENSNNSASNQIQVQVNGGNQTSFTQGVANYMSQPVMSVMYQPYRSQNIRQQVNQVTSGPSKSQQLIDLYNQVIKLYQQLLNQPSNPGQSANTKK